MRRRGRAWPWLRTTAVGALFSTTAGWSAGCSWVLTQPLPESWDRGATPVCSTSLVPPVVDSLFFLADTGGAIYAASRDVDYKALVVAGGLVEASLWLASAIYGYSKTSACQAALSDYAHGYDPPAFGTGGEVFTPPPPPPRKPDATPSGD
ncbi:MAG TPA: hypothetical protein VI456_16605 [Polyangia bacterium]